MRALSLPSAEVLKLQYAPLFFVEIKIRILLKVALWTYAGSACAQDKAERKAALF